MIELYPGASLLFVTENRCLSCKYRKTSFYSRRLLDLKSLLCSKHIFRLREKFPKFNRVILVIDTQASSYITKLKNQLFEKKKHFRFVFLILLQAVLALRSMAPYNKLALSEC